MSRRKRGTLALLPKLPLLITESSDEFDHIADAIYQELKPSGAIKQLYTADIIELSWEIQRLRRCKAGIVNLTFRPALKTLRTPDPSPRLVEALKRHRRLFG